MGRFDAVVLGGRLVLPGRGVVRGDVGIRGGVISAVDDGLASGDADEVIDASGRLVVPGAVDPHFHLGIYRDITEDTKSETLSSLAGGVTSVISYFRTGSHYLEKSGPYREIFPEVLEATKGHSRVDYGYHLAPMTRGQVGEIGRLVSEEGVASFSTICSTRGWTSPAPPGTPGVTR
jgi:dihydroorotase-like cyclic amidohydrolase